MPDTYKFKVPINFEMEIPGGVENPDWRPQLLEEIEKVIHTFVRAKPGDTLFDYPTQVDDTTIRVKSWIGQISTAQVPTRFKITEVNDWYHIASELKRRSTSQKDPTGKVIRKADVPYPVGRYATMIMSWADRYQFLQYKQAEMLMYWANKYSTGHQPPTSAKIKKQKADKKILKKLDKNGWSALKTNEADLNPVEDDFS